MFYHWIFGDGEPEAALEPKAAAAGTLIQTTSGRKSPCSLHNALLPLLFELMMLLLTTVHCHQNSSVSPALLVRRTVLQRKCSIGDF